MTRQHTNVLATWLFLLMATACGGDVIFIECPLGTMPSGAECVPYVPPDTTPNTYDIPIADTASWDDMGPNDSGSTKDTADTLPSQEDTTPPPVADIGSQCNKDSDCGEGHTCLNWPSGYCTILDCTENSCPNNASCVGLGGGNTACLLKCDSSETCVDDGSQACKTVTAFGSEEAATVCHGVDDDAMGIGSPCSTPSDCLGDAVCMALTASGYCATPFCEPGTCPIGSTCIALEDGPLCLRDCAVDEDCAQTDESAQQCKSKEGANGAETSVCVAAKGEKPVGAYCVTDIDCATGGCEHLGDGRCSQSKLPCSDAKDCESSEFCNIGPSSKVGICTTNCSLAATCPGLSFCVGDAGGKEGVCRKPCEGSDDSACMASDGFACQYGYPLGLGTGTYVCTQNVPAGPGAPCESNDQCQSGACQSGSCALPCGTNYSCPFGTQCGNVKDAGPLCLKACFSDLDCPTNVPCATPQGGIQKVCLAP